MLQTTPTPAIAPALLADQIAQLAGPQDREIAAILDTAAGALRALAWNRYAARTMARSRRHALKQRHTAR